MPSPSTSIVLRPDGAELAYSITGAGPAVLLISGLGGTASFWRPVVDVLSTQFSLVTFDQRGIGASSRGSGAVSIDALAEDALAVIDAAGVDRCTVIGHSTGGCIAAALATKAPERVHAAVLSATWGQATPYMKALFATRRALLRADPQAYASLGAMLGYPAEWLEAHWSVHDGAVRNAPQGEAALTVVAERIDALLAFDGRALLARLQAPCLVFGARDDSIVPLSAQRALHELLANGDFAVLETGGHFFPVTRTTQFCARVSAFSTSTA